MGATGAGILIPRAGFHLSMLDPEDVRKVDRSGMIDIVASLPEQLLEGARSAERTHIEAGEANHAFIAGMGGSAIAGDIFVSWAADRIKLDTEVVRGYALPPTAREQDILIAVSYSGDTEETLSVVAAAVKTGCRIVAITSGGRLEALCRGRGDVVIKVPPGLPPRGAFGHLFGALPSVAEDWVYGDLGNELERAAAHLTLLRPQLLPDRPAKTNPAKTLAAKLRNKTPIIYGAPPYGPVATRWKTQCNENAEVLAWASVFPEADHNEIVGWGGDPGAKRFLPILFRDEDETPEMRRRLDATREIMERTTKVHEVRDRGETLLGRMLGALYLGDFVSVYLAVLRGVDPMPVRPIAELKKRLAG